VDAADGLINNDNDTTIPTSAAIIDYVAGQITLSDLDFSGDGGSTGSVDLDSQVFSILGTSNEITTSGSGQTLTIGLPSSVTISGTLTATTFSGDLNGTINTATTAVTQPLGDNSTKVATTAFVDRVITAQDLDFQGTTGSGSVDLDSETFIIQGTTNEITTAATGQVLTVGLPSSITTDLVGNVTGNVTGNLTGDVTGNLTGNTNGIHTGNVVGDVTGDLTGNVTGNVVGDLTGNTTGLHTGNVIGNVTGDLSGNVVGNVTGDLTGNADTATAWANGRTITLTGEATGVTPSIDGTTNVSAALTLTNSAVIDKVLTGLQSPAGATILATDSMLIAFGKLQSQINGIAEGLQYQGSWNASTNTPTLTSSVGTQGFYYIVNVAGSTNLNGITDWEVGDWAIFSTTGVWQRLDQTGVQGTGTTGTLTKWATGSTISDSIVSESGTALTVTGSLDTTLGSNIAGDFSVNTNKFTVGSATGNVVASGQLQGNDLDIVTTSVLSGNVTMSADASVGGTLTTASPVINTGISGSAVLDDDTFATASATTVATSESIKAYVDSNTGSGTAGTIPKFATGGESLEDSIITETSNLITIGGGVKIAESTALNFGGRGAITQDGSYNFTWSTNGVANGFYLESATGNVGIGTGSTIYADLEIKRASEVTVALHNSSSITSGNRGNISFYNSSVSTVALIKAVADTDNVGTALEFYTRPVGGSLTNSLTISSGGDATFSGSVSVNGTGLTSSFRLNNTTATTGKDWHIYSLNGGNFGVYNNTDSSYALQISSGGNVGIGVTPNATTKVEVNIINSSNITAVPPLLTLKNVGAAHVAKFVLGDGTTSDTFITHTGGNSVADQKFGIGINATNQFVLDGNGNVGIGTATPLTKLDIRGTSATADSTLQIIGNGVSTLLLGQNSRGGVIRGQGGSNELSFWTGGVGDTGAASSGTERMRISSLGHLKISNSESWTAGNNTEVIGHSALEISPIRGGTDNSLCVVPITGNLPAIQSIDSVSNNVQNLPLNPFGGYVQIGSQSGNGVNICFLGSFTGTGASMFEPQNGSRTSYFGRENALGNHVFQTAITPYSTVIGAYNSTAPIVFGHNNAEVYIRNGGWTSFGSSVNIVSGLHIGTTSTGQALGFSITSAVIVSGSGWYDMRWNPNTGVVFHDGSCRLIKENIVNSPYGLETILKLKPRKYYRIDGKKEEIGFVADEVENIIPELVTMSPKSLFTKNDEDTEIIAGNVDYGKITAVLTKAIQEQQTIIDTLTARLDVLEKKA